VIAVIAVMDSSSIISISQSCLIASLGGLSGKDNRFVIPESVFAEVVEKPIQIKRFELNAVRIEKAVKEGWISVEALNARHSALAAEIKNKADSLFFIGGKPISLIHRGEAEALALTKQLGSSLLVIDERTTRSMLENPKQLKRLIERRRNKKVRLDEKNAVSFQKMFQELSIARSVELIALAFERNLIASDLPTSKQALEAALYAVKYAGCAVSSLEIEKFLAGVKG
jgi:predicted nucleic acid-binding protein